jgi:hypothetical protein
MVGGALDEATSVLLAVAPKVAVVAGIAALIMLCIPFTRQHARDAVRCDPAGDRCAAFPAVVVWLGGHSSVLTADVLTVGNTLLAHVDGQGG